MLTQVHRPCPNNRERVHPEGLQPKNLRATNPRTVGHQPENWRATNPRNRRTPSRQLAVDICFNTDRDLANILLWSFFWCRRSLCTCPSPSACRISWFWWPVSCSRSLAVIFSGISFLVLFCSVLLFCVVGTNVSPVVEAISDQPSADDNRLATVPETCAQRSTVQVSASRTSSIGSCPRTADSPRPDHP